ncbi:MAG: Eco57I restriction-modification methylase domain-containing protein [Saprospiraceae bacterium]
MNLTLVPFKKTLNKAYQKVKPNRVEIEQFKANLSRLLDRIDHEESEENAKNHLRDFLNDTWYKNLHLVNTKGRTDLVIHEGKAATGKAAVLFEVKRPKNVNEMISPANGNARAMHEMVLYYLQERIEHNNTDVKYLVITNIYDWYIFDAATFDRQFYQNKALRKAYEDWKNGRKAQSTTDFFYKEIARPFLEALDAELSAAYFNIRDFEKPLRNTDLSDDRKLISLFKIFSPAHLLKQPFANDSNSLDKGFYNELLYLIGLEEVKEGGKKIIQRCAAERRQPGSLLENTIATLENTERWRRVRKPSDYGSNKEEQIFGIALELCITWMNRILFLKLLEAQLVKYHSEAGAKPATDHRFLNTVLLKDFDDLNELFFEVLAKLPEERAGYVQEKFRSIPYLNSSLFELSEVEAETLFISNLKDRFRIRPIANTVLKNALGKRRTEDLTILEYLFDFLDAYDFASEGSEDIQEENKALINASVLGLIFEKLNGYKDGSFFTPGFITMYMARETVRQAVVQKFNTHYQISCDSFADLKNFTGSRFKTADVLDMNALVNSLRICDPAVGSGHFLVSALNELIAVKSELGILADYKGERLLGYDARVENDELIVTCNDGQDLFDYRVRPGEGLTSSQPLTSNPPSEGLTYSQTLTYTAGQDSQRVQETLFHEKQVIIENCLFGVDINPNSVKICRLRLWIELLKNTYYRRASEGVTSNFTLTSNLETLPNIDINIKTGNSLISRFALDADLSKALKSLKYDINTYRGYVQDYHRATDKEVKRGLMLLMDQIKSDFKTEIGRNDPKRKRLDKLASELYHRFTGNFLFEPEVPYGESQGDLEKKRAQEKEKLEKEIEKLKTEIDEVKSNKIFENAFEWRFEFPEVLDEEGRFVGFDVVVGNPPYFSLSKIKEQASIYEVSYQTYSKGSDIYCLFYERGNQILKTGGLLTYVTSNSWLRAIYGELLKKYFQENVQPVYLLNIEDAQVFEEATVESNILMLQKEKSSKAFLVCNLGSDYELGSSLSNYFQKNAFEFAMPESGDWLISSEEISNLKLKIEQKATLLKDFNVAINFGIKTGFNEAFIINEQMKDDLLKQDSINSEVIKPILRGRDLKKYSHEFGGHYLINAHNGIKKTNLPRIDLQKNFPTLFTHLESFQPKVAQRQDMGDHWSNLRNCAYLEDFEKPKIVWGEISDKPKFSYDDEGYYAEATTFLLTGEKLKYLLAILNSRVSEWYFNQISTTTGMGTNRWKKYKIELLPIKIPTIEQESKITILVDQILAQKRNNPAADTSALEHEIDELVYRLYSLTEEEITIIENKSK